MRLRYTLFLLLTAGLFLPRTAASQSLGGGGTPVASRSAASPSDSLFEVTLSETDADENSTEEDAAAAQQDAPELTVNINGSLRFNTIFRAYDTVLENGNDNVLGDGGFTFDTFRFGASGSYGDLIFDAEYAIYPESFGGLFIHHGWVGYAFADDRQVQVGVSQVPFGLQPYASSSWFFNMPYYVGLEDDYDAGIKAIFTPGNWELKGAYYLNAEQLDFFAGQNFSRYSYDVAPVSSANYNVIPGFTAEANDFELGELYPDMREEHQFNGKASYTFDYDDFGSTKIGASGQVGQLLNESTGDSEWSSAYALHLRGRYGGFDVKLEFAQQNLNPPLTDENEQNFADLQDALGDAGVDYGAGDFVVMGAYAFPQRVAADHRVYSSSVGYHIPMDWGPVSEIKPYYDFSLLDKDIDGWNNNVTHDVGFLTSAGPVYLYTDLNVSQGHPFNYPGDTFASVAAEEADNEWRVAFNMNLGVYF